MGCLRLRGPARAMELAKIIQDQSWLIKNLDLLGTYVESEMSGIRKDLKDLARLTGVGNVSPKSTSPKADFKF